jgi:hypothetical protein
MVLKWVDERLKRAGFWFVALLIVVGVVGNHELPRAHVWIGVLVVLGAVLPSVTRRGQRR